MPVSKTSSGHGKKPTGGLTKPVRSKGPYSGAKPGASPPKYKTKKTKGPYKGSKPGGEAAGKIVTRKVGGQYGIGTVTIKEHKDPHAKAYHNLGVYNGLIKPRSAHDRKVAQRGKAIRKLLAPYPKSVRDKGTEKYTKHTGALREGLLKENRDVLTKLNNQLDNPKLDPASYKLLQSERVKTKGEIERLQGRKYQAERNQISKERKKQEREIKKVREGWDKSSYLAGRSEKASRLLEHAEKHVGELKGAERKLENEARAAFAKSQNKKGKSKRQKEEALTYPVVTDAEAAPAKIKTAQPKNASPFAVNPLTAHTPEVKNEKAPELLFGAKSPKKVLFNVPKQPIPGGTGQMFGGRKYNRKEIQELQKEGLQVKHEEEGVSGFLHQAATEAGVIGKVGANVLKEWVKGDVEGFGEIASNFPKRLTNQGAFSNELNSLSSKELGAAVDALTVVGGLTAKGSMAALKIAREVYAGREAARAEILANAPMGTGANTFDALNAVRNGVEPTAQGARKLILGTEAVTGKFDAGARSIAADLANKGIDSNAFKIIADSASQPSKVAEILATDGRAIAGGRSARFNAPKILTKTKQWVSSISNQAADLEPKDVVGIFDATGEPMPSISGGGSPQSVLNQMAKSATEDLYRYVRPKYDGVLLRLQRGVIKLPIGVAALAGMYATNEHFTENAIRNVENLYHGWPSNTLDFLTATGEALAYGATVGRAGDLSPAEHIVKGILKESPIALAFQGKFDEAINKMEENPITFLLEIGGAEAAVGKTAGAIARGGARLGVLPETYGATGGRPDLPIIANVREIREYSPNLITKQAQKKWDKTFTDLMESQGVTTDSAGNYIFKNWTHKQKAVALGQKLMIKLEHNIDEAFSTTQIAGRAAFSESQRELGKILRELHKTSSLTKEEKRVAATAYGFIGMRIARSPETALADLGAYRKQIKDLFDKHKNKGSTDAQLKKQTLQLLDEALEHPKMLSNPDLWNAVEQMAALERGHQKQLAHLGAGEASQIEYAPWIPYLVNHHDARLGAEIGIKGPDKDFYHVYGNKILQADNGMYYQKTGWHKIGSAKEAQKLAEENHVQGIPMMITTRETSAAIAPERRQAAAMPTFDNYKNTGKNVRLGHADFSVKGIANQYGLSQSIINSRRAVAVMLDRYALRPKGRNHPLYLTSEEADHVINEIGPHMGMEIRKLNVNTFKRASEAYKDKTAFGGPNTKGVFDVAGETQGYHYIHKLLEESLTDFEIRQGEDPKAFVLMPARVISRLDEQQKYDAGLSKYIRKMNNEFKGSVLAFSPKWHIGNAVDMIMRLYFQQGFVGTVRASKVGHDLLKELKKLDPQAYNDVLATILGGHYSLTHQMLDPIIKQDSAMREVVHAFEQSQYRASATAIRLGKAGYEGLFEGAWNKGIKTPYRMAQRKSFDFAGFIEHHLKEAAFGRVAMNEARRLQLNRMSKHMGQAWGLQPDVVKQLAHGILEDHNVMTKYGKAVNSVMGDYTTMSPELRAAVGSFLPFGLWLRASTKWVLSLPAKSPIRTAMIAMVSTLNEDELAKLGLAKHNKGEGIEEYLSGSIPLSAKKLIRTNSYTSFGPLSDFSSLGNFFAPQIRPLLETISGKDWLGEEIVGRNGKPLNISQRVGVTLEQALEAYVVPLGIVHKLIAQGDPNAAWTFFKFPRPDKGVYPWTGVEERKFYKTGFENKEITEAEASPFKLSPTEGILAKLFSPAYISTNRFAENKEYLKRKADEEKFGKSEPGSGLAELMGDQPRGSTRKPNPSKKTPLQKLME